MKGVICDKNALNLQITSQINEINDLKPYAVELMQQLDIALEPEKSTNKNKQLFINQKVSEAAIMILILNGYLKTEVTHELSRLRLIHHAE